MADSKIVQSDAYPLQTIFSDKYSVDFYQREYVWQRKQIEDLMIDLSTEFLKNWNASDSYKDISKYDPYFMGEIVISVKGGERSSIIDGQQRITTLTLLLIYLLRKYGNHSDFPKGDVERLIYGNHLGEKLFNLDIEERKECMIALFNTGEYTPKEEDSISVHNIIERYSDIEECWNSDIDDRNIIHFVYWIMEKVIFSKVWTNSDEFAYVIFETMNDRGLSLTQVEMLRSYLLANIDVQDRQKAMDLFDEVVKRLTAIKLSSKSKAEFEFFKIYFRGHYAEDFSQGKNSTSDFVRIGKEFHRWVRDNNDSLGLRTSKDYMGFLQRISFYSKVYDRVYSLIQDRNTKDYLYLIVNNDYGFTLQPALILASINDTDSDTIIETKIKIVSKYLTKVLTWRVWNHWVISQSSMESAIYETCKAIRTMTVEELEKHLNDNPIELPELENAPTLNRQNKPKIKVLLSLITEIVASNSGSPDYLLNKDQKIEVEHIWADHYDQHTDECKTPDDFASVRNNIGDLLALPKSFNASYGDDTYAEKMPHYYEQNILAQTLCEMKYSNNPGFLKFMSDSGLPFKSYSEFKRADISERAELYKSILKWNWKE